MKERILHTLTQLRDYARGKGLTAAFLYHEEDSRLMRFANSAISLNTNEHLIRLEITVFDGRRRATYEMITDLNQLEAMQRGVDLAAEMVQRAMPLNYDQTLPEFKSTFADESHFDAALAGLSGVERVDYFNEAARGLETEEIKLSGIFSCGSNTLAQASTLSDHTQYFRTSDAQVNIVLAHTRLKWEVTAEQSACRKADLTPADLRRDLAYLVERYQTEPAQQIPVGKYDIVFGGTAIGDLLSIMNWIGFSGGNMKRGFSFLSEEQVGKKVFSEQFNLVDDPTRPETFPFQRDLMGLERKPFPLFTRGVFQGFTWSADDADEFSAQPTGHSVMHKSLVLGGGTYPAGTLAELVRQPRDKDILYIPFLHYMNIVNPSKGLVTASSRFGALLLKQDGSIVVPFNVRVTQSLPEIFGDKVAWLSAAQTANNTSVSYGARNPTAIVVPCFMRVNDLEISHSNTSY